MSSETDTLDERIYTKYAVDLSCQVIDTIEAWASVNELDFGDPNAVAFVKSVLEALIETLPIAEEMTSMPPAPKAQP